MITNEDYNEWGQKLFEKAKVIYEIEVEHRFKIIEIIEILKTKYNLIDDDLFEYLNFRSKTMNGFSNGPEVVKYYWLNYITEHPNRFINRSKEESFRKIIEDYLFRGDSILYKFNKTDFYYSGEFNLTYPADSFKKLIITVPYTLTFYEIEFAIEVIEKITKSKVSKISLWYFTCILSISNMNHEVEIAIDENKNTNEVNNYITKENFLKIKFSSSKYWYEEVHEFQEYINLISANSRANYPICKTCDNKDYVIFDKDYDDFSLYCCDYCGEDILLYYENDEENDFPSCKKCGDSNDVSDPGGSFWWCSHCEHSIDQEGKCVTDDCDTCEKNDSEENDTDAVDESDFPSCKTCGDSNDVSDPGGSFWWCSHCEHSIDQEGNSVTDDCDTCSKNLLNENDGPFYLFFDTETTGVPKNWKAPITNFENWPRIVQIAWIVTDALGNVLLKNEYIIKPDGFTIPKDASDVHGITTEYAIKFGVSLEEVLIKFEEHCNISNYIIAHNISFDSKVIGSEFLRILSRNPTTRLNHLCTMVNSTNFCKIPGNYGYKWPKLSELHIKLFGKDFEGAHNALSDIEATAKCFWEMRKLKLI